MEQSTLPSNEIPELQKLAEQQNRTGTVDLQQYLTWLHDHGYEFAR